MSNPATLLRTLPARRPIVAVTSWPGFFFLHTLQLVVGTVRPDHIRTSVFTLQQAPAHRCGRIIRRRLENMANGLFTAAVVCNAS